MTRFERLFVWIGGALFVTALAAVAFTYVTRWGRTTSGGASWTAAAIDVGLVTLFACHHSIFARDWMKQRIAALVPEYLLRSFYVWTASTLLILVVALWRRVGGDIYDVSGWRALLHTSIQLVGVWLIAGAVWRIDALELAGIRRPPEPSGARESLQVGGPYRWVRHPVYLGWILAAFGASHMTADRLTFAVITTAYVVVAIPWEEQSLIRVFGESYGRYAQRVRWRIIPYVY